MADNWYVILELEFDPPVEDEQKIVDKIDERAKFWSTHFNDFKMGAQYRAWHQNIPQIKKDMIGPANIRKQLAVDACTIVYEPVDKLVKTIGRKGFITDDEIDKLAKKVKISTDLVKKRALKLGIKHVPAPPDGAKNYQTTYDMKLKEKLEQATDNDYLTMLSAYMSVAEDGDEIVEAIYEFVSNCRGFVEANEDTTRQITKDEFEAVLDECEDKCGIESYMEADGYTLKLAEVPMVQNCPANSMKLINNNILLYLPRIDKSIDTKQYISEEIGRMLYEIAVRKLSPDVVLRELHRYIPETRSSGEPPKRLFRKYFYSVVKYEERKPGIYTEFDEYMKQVIEAEFYRRIIEMCYG